MLHMPVADVVESGLPGPLAIAEPAQGSKRVFVKTLKGERFNVDVLDTDTDKQVISKLSLNENDQLENPVVVVCETGKTNPRLCKPKTLELTKSTLDSQITAGMSLYILESDLFANEFGQYLPGDTSLSNADRFLTTWAIFRMNRIVDPARPLITLKFSSLDDLTKKLPEPNKLSPPKDSLFSNFRLKTLLSTLAIQMAKKTLQSC